MDRLDAIMAEIRKRTGDGDSPPTPTAPETVGTTPPPKRGRLAGGRVPTASASDPVRVRRRKQLIVAAAAVVGLAVLMPTIVAGVQGGIAQAKASASATSVHASGGARQVTGTAAGPGAVSASGAASATVPARDGLPPTAASPTPSGQRAGATPTALPEDWAVIVRGLDAARARALIARDPSLLVAVDAPGSVAMTRDRATITALRRAGLRATMLPLRVLTVRELAVSLGSSPARAVLTVEDVLAGYRLLADDGSVSREIAARDRTRWRMDLVQVPGQGWRIADVVSAATPRSP